MIGAYTKESELEVYGREFEKRTGYARAAGYRACSVCKPEGATTVGGKITPEPTEQCQEQPQTEQVFHRVQSKPMAGRAILGCLAAGTLETVDMSREKVKELVCRTGEAEQDCRYEVTCVPFVCHETLPNLCILIYHGECIREGHYT